MLYRSTLLGLTILVTLGCDPKAPVDPVATPGVPATPGMPMMPTPTFTPTPTPDPTPGPVSDGSPTASDVRQEYSEAASATGAYLKQKSDELRAWSRERMDGLQEDIARLRQKAHSDKNTTETTALEGLHARLDGINQRIDGFAEDSADKLRETRDRIDADLADIRERVSEMMRRNQDTTETQTL